MHLHPIIGKHAFRVLLYVYTVMRIIAIKLKTA